MYIQLEMLLNINQYILFIYNFSAKHDTILMSWKNWKKKMWLSST